jgi:hypothetical protein
MLVQLVCLDRRYQRMNCYNIRESQTQSWVGSKKFPNAPNNKGIIIKNTIITAWDVTILKYCKLSPAKTPTPG